MYIMRSFSVCLAALFGVTLMSTSAFSRHDFSATHGVTETDAGFETTVGGSFLDFGTTSPDADCKTSYLLMEVKVSSPSHFKVFWVQSDPLPLKAGSQTFHVSETGVWTTKAIDLSQFASYKQSDLLRLQPQAGAGLTFDVKNVRFASFGEVPESCYRELVHFRAFTGKLHYLPQEAIEYKATLFAHNWPEKQSSKTLKVKLFDLEGTLLAQDVEHFGLHTGCGTKELYGFFEHTPNLRPGKYTLEAEVADQKSGFSLTAKHDFGVIDTKTDPFVCETPFKFVKDFSIVKGPDNRWHVFSITGDFASSHDWYAPGQERTFSHSSSEDLRTWTVHEPVLSIGDDKYPDGIGTYKDRNIWAPHVISHGNLYYMFYTSVNGATSQSISLATSTDLFKWTDYEKNPVLTFEGVDWAHWRRDGGCAGRDPCVLEDGDKFYMYVTADAREGEKRGVVAVCESDDLFNWTNPQIAVRGNIASESPQVYKSQGYYYMLTSSHGAGTFRSKDPVEGWEPFDFPRPPVQQVEKYVNTSGAYAEEVVGLSDNSLLFAALTFRYWGNSIYIFRASLDSSGAIAGYESPFKIDRKEGGIKNE